MIYFSNATKRGYSKRNKSSTASSSSHPPRNRGNFDPDKSDPDVDELPLTFHNHNTANVDTIDEDIDTYPSPNSIFSRDPKYKLNRNDIPSKISNQSKKSSITNSRSSKSKHITTSKISRGVKIGDNAKAIDIGNASGDTDDPNEKILNIVILGSSRTGKTSIARRISGDYTVFKDTQPTYSVYSKSNFSSYNSVYNKNNSNNINPISQSCYNKNGTNINNIYQRTESVSTDGDIDSDYKQSSYDYKNYSYNNNNININNNSNNNKYSSNESQKLITFGKTHHSYDETYKIPYIYKARYGKTRSERKKTHGFLVHLHDLPGDVQWIRKTTKLSNYTSMADGFIIVYSVFDQLSFEFISTEITDHILNKHKEFADIPMILIANKYESPFAKHKINKQQGRKLAKEWNMNFVECSAKENHNIDQILKLLVPLVVEHKYKQQFANKKIKHHKFRSTQITRIKHKTKNKDKIKDKNKQKGKNKEIKHDACCQIM